MERTEISSGTSWERDVGYSRAVRVGDRIHVSGTTATDASGDPVAVGRPYEQAARALERVEDAIREAGGAPRTSSALGCSSRTQTSGRRSAAHTPTPSARRAPRRRWSRSIA